MKDIIKYSLLFLAIFCSPFNQFTYWAAILLLPFLLFGVKNKGTKLHPIIKNVLRIYLILSIATLCSSFLSFEFYHPCKEATLMLGCYIVGWKTLSKVSSLHDLYKVYDGLIISSMIFAFIVIVKLWHGGPTFDYVDEDSWLAKNVISVNIYSGVIASALRVKLSGNRFYLLPILLLSSVIIMTTSLKIIISVLFIILVLFFNLSKRDKLLSLLGLGILILIYKDRLQGFIESSEVDLLLNRIYTFFGLISFTTMDLSFVDSRKDLMYSALEVFYSNPLGIGLENTRLYMGTYSHNTYIELLCGSFVLLWIFCIYLSKIIFPIIKLRINNPLFILSIGCIISYLFIGSAMKIYDCIMAIFMLNLILLSNLILKEK